VNHIYEKGGGLDTLKKCLVARRGGKKYRAELRIKVEDYKGGGEWGKLLDYECWSGKWAEYSYIASLLKKKRKKKATQVNSNGTQ